MKMREKDSVFLAPTPKELEWKDGCFILPSKHENALPSITFENTFLVREVRRILGQSWENAFLHILSGKDCVKSPCNESQAYQLDVNPHGISIKANSETGLLYALQTLRQLKTKPGVFKCASIRDWPDMEFRICARPLLCAEACRSALAWGDGRKAEMKRWRREVDFALQCKYNGIYVHGCTWDTHPWKGFSRSMRALNRYARQRGVSLIFVGYGIGKGGWGLDSYIGEAHGFLPGAGHDFHQDYPCSQNNPTDERTAYNGTCRSNPELRRLKIRDITRFLKEIEPGAMYIHHEDHSEFLAECQPFFWLKRCQDCRKKWPNDALEAENGGAGAIADSYDVYGEARTAVKNMHYDASRDCRLILCSPAYGSWYNDDEEWKKVETLWLNVAKLMKYKDNVFFGMREQFAACSGKEGRLAHLSSLIANSGCPQKLMLFFVSGGALYGENAAFSSLPSMNSLVAGGSGAFFNFSGVLFQRPQQLYNSECTWNAYHRAGGETLEVTDREQMRILYAKRLSERVFIDQRHYDSNGYLSKACQWIYGNKAGKLLFQYQLLHTRHGDGPLVVLYQQTIMERLFKKLSSPPEPKASPSGLKRPVTSYADAAMRWEEQAEITEKGRILIEKARRMVNGWLGVELARQAAQLKLGCAFAQLIGALYRRRDGMFIARQFLTKRLKRIEKMMQKLPHDYESTEDGDGSVYPEIIVKIKEIIRQE